MIVGGLLTACRGWGTLSTMFAVVGVDPQLGWVWVFWVFFFFFFGQFFLFLDCLTS